MRILSAIFLAIAFLQPANAATTIYASSVFGTSGNVVGAANALGAANGLSASIIRVAGGSNLILQMSQAASGAGTVLNGQRVTAGSTVQIAIGEVIGGVATFSANLALPAGLGSVHNLDLSALCLTISSTGCSLIRIRVSGAPGSAFTLDGVSGVAAAPEPAAWSLMLLGFGATAWRLKKRRSSRLIVA
jgi:hypothetical protein